MSKETYEDKEKNKIKSPLRVAITTMLIGVCFTAFTLIWAFDRDIKFNYLILSQLAIAIPFLINSTIAYTKLAYKAKNAKKWNKFALITYTTGYSLIMNSIGIMIYLANLFIIAVLYFITIWTLEIIYSKIEYEKDKKHKKGRIIRPLCFISIQIILGFGIIVLDVIFSI
ncbi:MAG: hypothetical protein ACFFAS_11710 [Promethearchaeota archaeon]